MKGWACGNCEQFYSAVIGTEDGKSDAAKMCNECSKHRDHIPIQETPDDFFKLDF